MQIFRKIDRRLLQRCPRYRLWRICKAIGIKPYRWQKEFALGDFNYLPPQLRDERASGKTFAVYLRILMIPENNAAAWAEAGRIFTMDPSYYPDMPYKLLCVHSGEYRRLKNLCLAAGIPVLQVEIYRMIEAYKNRR